MAGELDRGQVETIVRKFKPCGHHVPLHLWYERVSSEYPEVLLLLHVFEHSDHLYTPVTTHAT